MNKKLLITILVVLVVALVIGGVYFFTRDNQESSNVARENITNIEEQNETENTNTKNGNILVAYYSYSGNTESFANVISKEVGGDLFKIERAEEYSDLYTEAEAEINNNEKPELAGMPENVEQYDTIFIGYPIWWDRTPAMINTFLENIDLTGKTVIPFCTSSSDSIEGSMKDINNSASEANILEGLRISGGSAESNIDEIQNWLEEIGY